jgi:hypothetical protein
VCSCPDLPAYENSVLKPTTTKRSQHSDPRGGRTAPRETGCVLFSRLSAAISPPTSGSATLGTEGSPLWHKCFLSFSTQAMTLGKHRSFYCSGHLVVMKFAEPPWFLATGASFSQLLRAGIRTAKTVTSAAPGCCSHHLLSTYCVPDTTVTVSWALSYFNLHKSFGS